MHYRLVLSDFIWCPELTSMQEIKSCSNFVVIWHKMVIKYENGYLLVELPLI